MIKKSSSNYNFATQKITVKEKRVNLPSKNIDKEKERKKLLEIKHETIGGK